MTTPHLMTPLERRQLRGLGSMEYELVGVDLLVREHKGRPVLTCIPRSVMEAIYQADGGDLWGWTIWRATPEQFEKGFTWKASPPERIERPGDKEEVGVGGTKLTRQMEAEIEGGRSRHELRDAMDRHQLDSLLDGIFQMEIQQRAPADILAA